jgi:2',3'-cyclic-nucleotide 2'-phosphodiesterase (5'-nucleotidase family)
MKSLPHYPQTYAAMFLLAACQLTQAAPLGFKPIANLPLAGSEISAYDPASERMFVTASTGLQVIDLSDPASPTLVTTVDFTTLGLPDTDVTSVSVFNGVAAVSLPAAVKTNIGRVAFINTTSLALISSVTVGSLPDALTFTPDGTKVLVANEGELAGNPIDDVTPGTVSIIDVSNINAPSVTSLDFTAYDDPTVIAQLKADGVRIFANGKPSTDFEPEYIAVSPDSTKAMVTLQEANAVALIDIATSSITDVVALGEKDFSTLLADFGDRDGAGNTTLTKLTRGNPVSGLYMPDAIASYSFGGNTYYITANEGDDRDDFLSVAETIRVGSGSYVLDPTVFPNAATLKTNARLSRLTVSNSPGLRGDTDNDGDVDRILTYGARSFSILDANGNQVYDSGDFIERAMANIGSPWFDDTRSDNKGPEPEGVKVGVIDGATYAFITLERSRGVMVFDVSNPSEVTPAGFATVPTDSNPEDVTFIPAAQSPNGKNLLISTNEANSTSLASPTLTVFEVEPVDYTLQLLHLADAEAGLLASQTAPHLAALVDAFDDDHANTLILAGGDNFIPGPFMNAGTDPSMTAVLTAALGTSTTTAFGRPDIAIHNILGVEASAVGNHEFDLGSNVLSDAISIATFPHVTANINFALDPLNSRFTAVTLDGATTPVPVTSAQNGRIVPTATIEKGGEKIGLVGVTTQLLESISSPSGARINGFATPGSGVNDMDLLATQVQPYINELIAEGVDKIVLLSHLQQIANEQSLATKISGVDIIIAAGSNTRLGDADDTPVAFPGHDANFAGNYPLVTAGLDGAPTLIVNTDNEFTYLGRLIVDFDADGEIITPNLATRSIDNGAYASTATNVATAWGVDEADLGTTAFATGTKGARVKMITDAINGIILAKDGQIFGFTDVYLEGERAFVRREETNFGNITADANAIALRDIIGGTTPIVSLKNGGGIRAQIGSIAVGSGEKLPPAANPAASKPAGAVSKLDIENALRFNNRLMAFETTPAGLKAILEHGVAATWPGNGRFPQIGGVSFSWDIAQPVGSRIQTIALIDENGSQEAAIYQDGAFLANAPASIMMVTLNFLAQGGDSYPIKANGENFRYILNDDTLSPIIPESADFAASGTVPTNTMGEQQAFEEYLVDRHPTVETAYDTVDTPLSADTRIQKLDTRSDEVLPFSFEEMVRLNTFRTPFLEQGIAPLVAITSTSMAGAINDTVQRGIDGGIATVQSNPRAYGLFTAPGIRLDASFLEFTADATATMKLQSSDDLETWTDEATVENVEIDLSGGKRFFRFQAQETP